MNIEEISINIHGSGKRFWATISQATTGKDVVLWEQVETSESLQEAFDRGVYARDRIIEAEEKEAELAAEDRSMGLTRVPRETWKDE